jgi:large subunit ribosomal protein L21
MYAIIRSGGTQSKVAPGDVIDVERLKNAGDEVEFTPLLVVDDSGTAVTGRDALNGVKVRAKVLGEVKGDKIDIFKYKNKTGYRRRQGHRQRYTQLEITAIDMPKAKKTTKKKADAEQADASEGA